MRLLILGGTTEATALAAALAGRTDVGAVLSLAGRTAHPAPPPIPCRIGGFGGVAGLVDYLRREGIDAVIDATHPFAEQMSRHAVEATQAAGVPLVVFTRAPWDPVQGDRWTEVPDAAAAAAAIGPGPRVVFLTVGRLSLPAFAAAPQHLYLVRSIDPPAGLDALPRHRLVLARGPFAEDDERLLMREHRVEVLVTKNSGGAATRPKLDAARALGLPVILIRRPADPGAPRLHDLQAVLDWIETHRATPALRGV